MKIKITEKEKVIEGTLEKGRVTPFGTAGHIISQKKHIGKKINIVIPENTTYEWILSKQDLKRFIVLVEKRLNNKKETKQDFYLKKGLERIKDNCFYLVDLNSLIESVEVNSLTNDIKKTYNI